MPKKRPEDFYTGMSEDEVAAYVEREKSYSAERRRQSRSPEGIESTNRRKRNGNLSFTLTPDGKTFIVLMTTNNAAARLLMERIARLSPKIQRFKVGDKGHHQVEIPVEDPQRTLELAGCKPVPEKCQRCDGHGALDDKDGKPSSSSIVFGGATLCPACKGSGRALVEDE